MPGDAHEERRKRKLAYHTEAWYMTDEWHNKNRAAWTMTCETAQSALQVRTNELSAFQNDSASRGFVNAFIRKHPQLLQEEGCRLRKELYVTGQVRVKFTVCFGKIYVQVRILWKAANCSDCLCLAEIFASWHELLLLCYAPGGSHSRWKNSK